MKKLLLLLLAAGIWRSYERWNFDRYLWQLEKMQTRLIGEKTILGFYRG